MSIPDTVSRFRVDVYTGCWIWEGPTNNGYGWTGVEYAHRAMWRIHRGDPPPYLARSCRTKLCVNPDHLRRGRSGNRNPASKLTPEDVAVIRMTDRDVPQRVLADRFGVNQTTISRVLSGDIWPDV